MEALTTVSDTGNQWYIHDCHGEFSFRIKNGIKLGELASGQLAFDDGKEPYQWIKLYVKESGELWIEVTNPLFCLEACGRDRLKNLRIDNGSYIQLPNNGLCISDNPLRSGENTQTIRVTCQPEHSNLPVQEAQSRDFTDQANTELPYKANPPAPNSSSLSVATLKTHDWRIGKALRRVAEGNLVSPYGDSAVFYLSQIDRNQSEYTKAKSLLKVCANQLIAKAELHYSMGLLLEAMQTLEEIFTFAPEHSTARILWENWKIEYREMNSAG